jgi:hypothetical protein
MLIMMFVIQIFRHPYTATGGVRPTVHTPGSNAGGMDGGSSSPAPQRVVNSNAVHPEEAITNAGSSEGGGCKVSSSTNPLKVAKNKDKDRVGR